MLSLASPASSSTTQITLENVSKEHIPTFVATIRPSNSHPLSVKAKVTPCKAPQPVGLLSNTLASCLAWNKIRLLLIKVHIMFSTFYEASLVPQKTTTRTEFYSPTRAALVTGSY